MGVSSPVRADQRWTFGNHTTASIVNALSVDVEDYFQVSAFEDRVSRADWHKYESRVSRNTERLLARFDEYRVTATFFILGWVADRFPELVRRIATAGHEIASHGYEHRLIYTQSRAEFIEDLRRARQALENATGRRVVGFRAPSYSITQASMWALDVLIEEGYEYDASIFPIKHDRYGIPDWPRHLHRVRRPSGLIWEFPCSTVRWGGLNFPIGGGGYFRLLPYEWTRQGLRHVNHAEGESAMFYLHPWEIDPEQPRLAGSALSRFRHYRNLGRTEERLGRLLAEFRFCSVSDIIATRGIGPGDRVPVA